MYGGKRGVVRWFSGGVVRFFLVLLVFILGGCGGSSEAAMFRANLQRTGVYGESKRDIVNKLKWKFKTGYWITSSPAVYKGGVYFGSDDTYLYALDAETGELKWKFETWRQIESSPAVYKGVVYFGSWDGYFYALGE
ncbi:PQQ-binding-like beta-propeller repeat protein [Candidatus Calescamantes bacterium]|nr:PQQ-binding-like beta-propeller repeat protein [Candidatus Calescamantes bacterium]